MKFILGTLLIALLTALTGPYIPWWCCGIIAFIIVLILRLRMSLAFLAGLIGVGLAWGIVAGWIDAQNSGILSGRIGVLFGGLPSGVVLVITALLGGLVGGLGGMTAGALASRSLRRGTHEKSVVG